ncbi:MarR family winged helix-turn-helix transcriptional regulator [Terrisporobacter hibernicus]|uniref:MarR family winged helix-turn-helix transcriptional regulator n=1 Tax=Terrisporobacter hibernicus TaxID=2813371 RepID=A0AAX2ZGZ3_9FIRM|nr:MarR family winged helix-turn-helix transcriptional regulator [Terrisporobacter hibernicus]UEL48599.1 MarR family winged helix-turn-helix transcriptional regulator [Terrisporobacter hibernicus]UPA31384.1 MarR family winged helix-turn-helix transcriptional regulator [Terrisporobacter glycolicus]
MKYDSFEIAMLIKEIYASTIEIVNENLKGSSLTHQQTMVIKLIAHKEKVTISELCQEMSLAKGTISGIVSRLERADYVKKVKYDNDKRNTYVEFSDKGYEYAKNFRNEINKSFDKIFENFTEDEVKKTKNNLIELRNKLKGDNKSE